MDMISILKQTGGLDTMAKELGIDSNTAATGAAALLPAVLGGMKKSANAQGGIGDLVGMLGGMGGGALLDQVLAPQPTPVDSGNNILGQIFGSKEVSRTVADHASAQTGIDSGILKKMLPVLAMMVAGYMAKQHGGQSQDSGLGGVLGGLLGGMMGGGAAPAAPSGLGGLASMLDFDGDGNPLDDIMGMASKFRG
ncbi:MAG: DUF937 domain-containing protein [bacterium]